MLYLDNSIHSAIYMTMFSILILFGVFLFISIQIQRMFIFFSPKCLTFIFVSLGFISFTDFCIFLVQKDASFCLFLTFSTLFSYRIFLQFLCLNFEIHLSNSILPLYVYVLSFFITLGSCFYILYKQKLLRTFWREINGDLFLPPTVQVYLT